MTILEANLGTEWPRHLGQAVVSTAGGEACLTAWREHEWDPPEAAGTVAYALRLPELLEFSELDDLWIRGTWPSNDAVGFARYDWISSSEVRANASLESIFDEPALHFVSDEESNIFVMLSIILQSYLYRAILISPQTTMRGELEDFLGQQFRIPTSFKTSAEEQIAEMLAAIEPLFDVPSGFWSASLDPWETLTERLRNVFGTRRSILGLAVGSAINPTGTSTDPAWRNILDHDVPLVRRLRYARLRAGDARWWSEVLESEPNDIRTAAIAILLATGSSKTLTTLAPVIRAAVEELTLSDFDWLSDLVRQSSFISRKPGRQIGFETPTLAEFGPSVLYVVWRRLNRRSLASMEDELKTHQKDPLVAELQSLQIIFTEPQSGDAWDRLVDSNERACRTGGSTFTFAHYREMHREMRPDTARRISEDLYRYGYGSLMAAVATLDTEVQKSVEPVVVLASNNHWFSADQSI